jgi:DNA-binding transcriptional LysR family regulator
MLNLRQIEVFRAVMIARTVTGAAQMLHVSQPGLSRMLRHTEDRLGIRLFERVSGRLLPTHEANALFAEIQQIYKCVEGLEHIVQRLANGTDTIFRLGSSPSLAVDLMPSVLQRLRDKFPNLTVRFDVLGLGEVADYLVTRQGEYALSVFPVSHPNVASRRIGEARFVCVLPKKHKLARRSLISVRDLAGESLISFGNDTPHGQIVAELFARAGAELKVSTFVRFAETACAFVRAGMGIALVDEFTARGTDPDFVRAIPVEPRASLPLILNRAHYAVHSRVSDEFEKLLLQVLRGGAPARARHDGAP